jgi:hypothetical protein
MLRRARDEFAHLLAMPTNESTWQRFFASNRHALSASLPLKLLPCDIVPLGRPGRSEPDFLIYPGSDRSAKLHGIIELKTPDARVVRQPRRNVLTLSDSAQTAVRQVLKYDQGYDNFAPMQRTLSFQAASHLFIIIGRASELMSIEPSLLGDLKTLFPPGIRFLGFDELFHNLDRQLPKSVVVLAARPIELRESDLDDLLGEVVHLDLVLHRLVAARHIVRTMGIHDHSDRDTLPANEALTQSRSSNREPIDFRVLAPFSHPSPMASRFRPAGVGGFYGTTSLAAALAEHRYHLGRFHEATEAGPTDVVLRHYTFNFSGTLARLPRTPLSQLLLDPETYDFSVQAGRMAIRKGIEGILYPSVRSEGLAAIIYTPHGISPPEDLGSLVLSWNGTGWVN